MARTAREADPELAGPVDDALSEAESALGRFALALGSELRAHHDDLSFAIGEDQFNRRLHHEHALRAGAPELYRYGLHLADEVEAEVKALARQIDPRVSWHTVVERLRVQSDPGPDLVGAFRDAVERARTFLEARGLVTLPPQPLEVVETPAFLRPLMPFAAYSPPAAFGGLPHRHLLRHLPGAGTVDAARGHTRCTRSRPPPCTRPGPAITCRCSWRATPPPTSGG